MTTRKLSLIVLYAVAILWPAGCGSMLKSDAGNDQQFISDARKNRNQETRDAEGPTIQPETYMAAGRLHETQGRLVKAAEQYRLAVAAKPDSVEGLNRLGMVLDKLGRFKEADEVFIKAIRLAPDKAHLHNNLAFSYILQQRWREAEVCLTKAIEINPGMTRARVNLAMAGAQQGRFDDAFTHFKTVLPIEDAHYNMGLMYQSKRMNVEAARSFKAALRANPKLVAAQQRLDAMPKDVVSQAEQSPETVAARNTETTAARNAETIATQSAEATAARNAEAVASPLPESLQLAAVGIDLTPQPTTRPAIELTPSAVEESRPASEPMPEERQTTDASVLDVAQPEVAVNPDSHGLVSELIKQLSDQMMLYVAPESVDGEPSENPSEGSKNDSEDGQQGSPVTDAVVADETMPRDD